MNSSSQQEGSHRNRESGAALAGPPISYRPTPLARRAPRGSGRANSRHRLRRVLRLSPRRRAARSWLPPVTVSTWASSGRSSRASASRYTLPGRDVASWSISGGMALAISRVSAGSVPPEPSARSSCSATTMPRLLAPPSVGQGQANAADRREAVVGVDGLEVRVEYQELHARLDRPAAERGGDKLERHGQERSAREVTERLVLAVHGVVILDAEAERDGGAHRQGIRRLFEERVARGEADPHVDALLAVGGQGLALRLEGEEQARIQGESPQPLRIAE